MAKVANPFIQIAKKLESLQAKSIKINEELKVLAGIVEVEMKRMDAAPAPVKSVPVKASPKTVVGVAPAKADKSDAAPKKRGRPAKK
ncbi:MAG: hypothetical protein CVV47_13685 [Spirochaetae bacterium HGW-Spirochaetae-3]|jgi:hypothetical protein|nr:MAG: hypothetical protein CVV47_13685 [Spirochaetae bacterium HGW-Spirochaetae-3]